MAKVLPVVDGEEGADIYGHATTERGAVRVARRYFADGCNEAYLSGPIQCTDGTRLELAWVALSAPEY